MLSNGMIVQFLPLVLVFGVFYFVVFKPQQARQRELKAQLKALRRGDRIVSSGGLIGIVQVARDGADEIEVEIAQGTRIMLMRENVARVLVSTARPANDQKKTARKA